MKRIYFMTLLFLSACNYSEVKNPAATDGLNGLNLTPDQISFQNVSEKVFQPKCIVCHAAATGNKGGVNLETYQNAAKQAAAIRSEIAAGSMPPPESGLSLSAEEANLVLAWVDAGAHQYAGVAPTPTPTPTPSPTPAPTPAPTPSPTPTPSAATFSQVMSQVITPRCLNCHASSTGNRGGVNLETYAKVYQYRNRVKSEISSGSMPIGSRLTTAQKNLVASWVSMGALNN